MDFLALSTPGGTAKQAQIGSRYVKTKAANEGYRIASKT
jgi:hypothetical protein